MQKNALLFFLISVRCAVLKDPPKKVTYVECTCLPFFPLIPVRCAVLKDPSQKKCDVLKCQKNARALLLFLISVRCAVRKDLPKRVTYKERTHFPFFHHIIQMQKWRELKTEPCWPSGPTRRAPIREFLSSKSDGAKFFKKKQNAKKRVKTVA